MIKKVEKVSCRKIIKHLFASAKGLWIHPWSLPDYGIGVFNKRYLVNVYHSTLLDMEKEGLVEKKMDEDRYIVFRSVKK